MTHPGFTIKDATLTTDNATKYHFNNNMCNHISLTDRFSILKWYQCGDYHMFFALGSYPSDDMSPPKTHEEFVRGQIEMDTMYWFTTEHLYAKSLTLIKKDDEIECIATHYEGEDQQWVLTEVDYCLGVYRLDGNVLHHVYDTYQESFHRHLIEWKTHFMGILEKVDV